MSKETSQNVWDAANKDIYEHRDYGELVHDGSTDTISLTLSVGNYTAEVAVDSRDFTVNIAPQYTYRGITPLAPTLWQERLSNEALSRLVRSSRCTRCNTGLTRHSSSRLGSQPR